MSEPSAASSRRNVLPVALVAVASLTCAVALFTLVIADMAPLGWADYVAGLIFTPAACLFVLVAAFSLTERRRRAWLGLAWAIGSQLLLIPLLQWWGFAASAALGIVLWRAPSVLAAAATRRDYRRAGAWLRRNDPSADDHWTTERWEQALRCTGAHERAAAVAAFRQLAEDRR